jgi:2-keto-4-pentenoate hydratase/2-oxohepta-3-ene-1,7-dioic acid hydratase in catechol pathway
MQRHTAQACCTGSLYICYCLCTASSADCLRRVRWRVVISVVGLRAPPARTSQMVNDPRYLIHYLSYYVTLTPGDVIFTGTVAPPVQPGHHRDVADGDVVEIEIEKIGVLRNVVRLAAPSRHSSPSI